MKVACLITAVILSALQAPSAAADASSGRRAATPEPTVAATTRGAVDTVSETAGTFVVYGWAWNTTNAHLLLRAEINGISVGGTSGPYTPRADVSASVPGAPLETGFQIFLDLSAPRTGRVCVHGADAYGNNTGSLGCLPIPPPTSEGSPRGALDEVRAEAGRVAVRGWAVDPNPDPDPQAPFFPMPRLVHVYMDDQYLVEVPLDKARPDVAASIPHAGPVDGYGTTLPARPGRHQICVYAINRGRTGRNALLDCRTVDVPARTGDPAPFGSVDNEFLGPSFGGTGNESRGVRGWAAAPGGGPIAIRIVAVGGFLGNGDAAFDVTGSTGVARPDVAAAKPGTPPDAGYEIIVGGGHFLEFRLACVIARSAGGAESVLGCLSYVRFDGRHF